LILVSVGLPEKGHQIVVEHLGVVNGEDFCYVDPENVLYDALSMNRGVGRMMFHPATPLAFWERLTKPNGTQELRQVLSKYAKGKSFAGRVFHLSLCTPRGVNVNKSMDDRSGCQSLQLFMYNFQVGLPLCRIIRFFYYNTRTHTGMISPPKPNQSLLQGGTFVVQGERTLYAHYDPSTAAHAPMEEVLQIAQKQAAAAKAVAPGGVVVERKR